jgi:hypothetical protein
MYCAIVSIVKIGTAKALLIVLFAHVQCVIWVKCVTLLLSMLTSVKICAG